MLPALLASVVTADAFAPGSFPRLRQQLQTQQQRQQQQLLPWRGGAIDTNNPKIKYSPDNTVPLLRCLEKTSTNDHDGSNPEEGNSRPNIDGEEENGEASQETSDKKDATESIPRGGGTNIHNKPPALPTLADYRKFALPCLGLWVAQPLLSLVDTAFVGLSGNPSMSASNLAALGPATTFFDGATYLFAFLNVATTNLYSTARAQHGEQSDQAESVVRTASRVALRCGVGIMVFLLAFARPLLALYIGTCSFVAKRPGWPLAEMMRLHSTLEKCSYMDENTQYY
jgi:hypothetical protein